MPLFTSSSPKLWATFPTQHSVVRPGDYLDLVAHLAVELDSKGRSKMDAVTAELRGTMVTTYYRTRNNAATGNRHHDKRTQETILLSQIQTIWTPDQTHSFSQQSSGASSSTGAPIIDISIRLRFPPIALPPSFEGGSRTPPLMGKRRQVDGHEVARVVYFVKLHGRKGATFSIDDRIILPFIFSPPPSFDPQMIPPTLAYADQPGFEHAPPPAPTVQQGWATMALDHKYRERMLGNKMLLITAFSAPSIPSVPIGSFYPFRFSFLTLSAPVSTSQQPTSIADFKTWQRAPPAAAPFALPNLSLIELTLERNVWTKARGASQAFTQTVGLAYSLGNEQRVWYSGVELLSMDDYAQRTGGARGCKPGEKRWAVEIVVVGEMLLGKGMTAGISPSFGQDITRGLLSCSYHLALKIPCKGTLNNLTADPFLPIVLSGAMPPANASLEPSDAPPDYYAVVSGSGSGFDDVK